MQSTANILLGKTIEKTKRVLGLRALREKLLQKKINSFESKINFVDEHKRYKVMTATQSEDLEKILRLRHKIFVTDMGKKAQKLDVDFDRYDLMGDHIMIIDQKEDRVIGTYRVISSMFTNEFYSENEFVIGELKARPEKKVELGRACIHPDYRNGITLHLIWRGLARYVKLVDARYLFGCSSIFEMNPEELQKVLHKFSNDQWGSEFHITPKAKYTFANREFILANKKVETESVGKIPALLMGYLKAGAKIYGQPALDAPFGCADVFTILDMENLSEQYFTKYFKDL